MAQTSRKQVTGRSKKRVQVGIVMGSDSDMRVMKLAIDTLKDFGITNEVRILSAHRTPNEMLEYAADAESRGLKVLIAGAGGAAHLPGMIASATTLPVIGVPVNITALDGIDAFLSIVQMPKGVPVATVAIDNATNAALLAVRILGCSDEGVARKLHSFRDKQAAKVRKADKSIRKTSGR
jgi:phosphoribosylaminoimidazole carboxylase PurE protein